MTNTNELITGPFYHGTKAELKPGDLITPGFRSNYGHGMRTSAWVYMSALFSPWAAELAAGDGPGRIYIVEATGPFEDDPDLTDKRFAGNPTQSYRSRFPLRVVEEVTGWQSPPAEEIAAMRESLERLRAEQALRLERIPGASDIRDIHEQADSAARAWASDAEYCSCQFLMVIRGVDVAVFSAMTYHSQAQNETCTFELPRSFDVAPELQTGEITASGSITNLSAWHEGWAAVIESCVTEIGLSLETRLWVTVDAMHDTLSFRLDAEGPERSWRRNLKLEGGVLTDGEYGEIWDFEEGSFS